MQINSEPDQSNPYLGNRNSKDIERNKIWFALQTITNAGFCLMVSNDSRVIN